MDMVWIMSWVLGAILTVVVIIYWYLTKDLRYWEKIGIPHEKGTLLFGSYGKAFKKSMHIAELERYKKYGRIYGFYEGGRPVLYIAEPDLLKDIFVKDFHVFPNHREMFLGDPVVDNILPVVRDEKWKRIRTLVAPAFTTGRMKRMVKTILESAKTLKQNLKKVGSTGEPINGKTLFGAFAMDVIASCAFATKIDSFNDPENEFVVHAREDFNRNIPWRHKMLLLLPRVMKFLNISVMSPVTTKFFKDITLQIISARKETGQVGDDFLQLMIDASERGTDVEEHESAPIREQEKEKELLEFGHEENNAKVFNKTYKTLTHDELVAQCVIFFLGGYESTSTTMVLAAYELAENPGIQEKLISVIDETILKHKGEFSYEFVQEITYLDLVIRETLRMYAPGLRLEREAKEDYKLGDTGITIPKNLLIYVPVYAMHHDPEFFPEPEKFIPERFLPEEKSRRHPYTYLPFGAGPRNCVSMRFALMEIKVCLAYLLTQLRFKKSGLESPLEFFVGHINLAPKRVMFKIEMRDDKVIDI